MAFVFGNAPTPHRPRRTERILELTVDSLNGLRNSAFQTGKLLSADTQVLRARKLLADIQNAGAISLSDAISGAPVH